MGKQKDQSEKQVETDVIAEDPRQKFGRELGRLRDQKSLSIEALAHVTRIKPEFISILEQGDFGKLPGRVFGRGFVKSLCRALDSESGELIGLYDSCWEAQGRPKLHVEVEDKTCSRLPVEPKQKRRLSISVWQVGGALTGLFAVVLLSTWFGLENQNEDSEKIVEQHQNDPVIIEASDLSEYPPVEEDITEELVEFAENVQLSEPEKVEDDSPIASQTETSVDEQQNLSVAKPNSDPEPEPVVVAKQPESGKPKEEVVTLQPDPGSSGKQTVAMVVKKKVRARIRLDEGDNSYINLEPNTYQYEFNNIAQFLIFDAAAVDIIFNGRNIGSLGEPGRVRRIGFAASSDTKRL